MKDTIFPKNPSSSGSLGSTSTLNKTSWHFLCHHLTADCCFSSLRASACCLDVPDLAWHSNSPPNKWAVSNCSEQAGPEHGAPSQGHILLFSFLQTQCFAYLFDYINKQKGYAKYFTAALFRAQLQGGGAQALLPVASKVGPHAMKLHCPPVVAWARGGVLACWDPTAREDGGCMGQQQICLKKAEQSI